MFQKTMCMTLLAVAIGIPFMATAQESRSITVVVPEQPDSMESCNAATSNISRVLSRNVNESLTLIDPSNGEITPYLALSWERVSDLTWRFKLRENVKFHDGADFNADAVVFNIERLMNKNLDCSTRTVAFGGLDLTARSVDPTTVEISTGTASPIFPTLASTIKLVSPNTPVEITRTSIGTGPYQLDSWRQGENVQLKRFDGYWGDAPQVEKVTYVWRSESSIRAAMVAAGEADLSPYIARQDATNTETDTAYLNAETSNMRIDTTVAPLTDARVRKALNLALDREALRTAIFGESTVPAAQLVTEAVLGYNPELKLWEYNPEEAKRLIAEAKADGVDVTVPMTIIARPNIYPNASEAVEALMAMWGEVGLTFAAQNFEIADWLKYLRKPFPENIGPNVQQEQHDNGKGDAIFTIYNKYHSQGTVSKLNDPKLDALIEKGQAATGEERKAAFQEVFRYLHEDIVADVPLFHMVGYARISPNIVWTPNLQTNNEINLSEITFKN